MTVRDDATALVEGRLGDPSRLLGPRAGRKYWTVRTFAPGAEGVSLVDQDGQVLAPMRRVHPGGLYEARLPLPIRAYRLRLTGPGGMRDVEDPYRFEPRLGELDQHLLGEGTHARLYERLGAHPMTIDGVDGVWFAVWAPRARRVSVVGPFNGWDGRHHVMCPRPGPGCFELFVPGVREGALYKFELLGPDGQLQPLKADPFARAMEAPPGNASIVARVEYDWADAAWMSERPAQSGLDRAMSIYEVHLGSWRRHPDGRQYSYRELADALVPYVAEMGYTHIELMPVAEHPFEGSWGYQPVGLFAPTWRFGPPEDFKHLVDACHRAGIGVIVDWVPAHFPRDTYGLPRFDGLPLYEHADSRRGEHPDWGTLVFDLGRNEVVNYLVANALYWIREYHIDALRVDAVASMLYLDYSREPGQWLPNQYGGKENLETVAFLRRLNEVVHAEGAVTMAEESTAWPGVSRPTYVGGLGFTYKWNMGWMHDSLDYMSTDPVHRGYHHQRLTFGLLYAYSENFVLPLSHDEVVHGKGSLIARMPGDAWQRFANLRLYFAYMYAHPGKKLLFMGGEFAQPREWNHDGELDWGRLAQAPHAGVQSLVRDLNHLYRDTPALYEVDFDAAGFEWLVVDDVQNSVAAFVRRDRARARPMLVACNFTPVPRADYRLGVPMPGRYVERLNTDAPAYGGSGVGNPAGVASEAVPAQGHAQSIRLNLPPLAAIYLDKEDLDR